MTGSKKLNASPRDLGISRADLWAFTGLAALDKVQETSRELCSKYSYNLTCNDWKSSCYAPFPKKLATTLFKNGRIDCTPSSTASSKQTYLSSKIEVGPDQNGNGKKTAKFFKDNFDMNPREALALMGAHTIGRYSTFLTHIDYAWVRELESQRNQVFNNEYYKTLVSKKAHTKDKYCVGTMDGSKAVHQWYVTNLQFEYYWPQKTKNNLWIEKPRRLLWNHFVTRAPVCEEEEEDKLGDGDTFWNAELNGEPTLVAELEAKVQKDGFSSFWEYCCKQKKSKCWKKGECDPECTRTVQNRIRHLSADVGWYLKWEIDSLGYPTKEHCEAFKDLGQKDDKWKWFKNKEPKGGEGDTDRLANCPKQDMDDGHGQKMWETVEMYADNQELWIKDFVKAWDKMSQNGYSKQKLVQGPTGFWRHL